MKTAYLKYNSQRIISHINPEIYGHFSEHLGRCIYDGIFVGKESRIANTDGIRNDVITALKEIGIPVLRWSGGCFAEEYHWRDGIGQERRRTLNANWGQVIEDNTFGTHEFFRLCELLGCKAYLAGNLGSGTVQELSEWLEYITGEADTANVLERRQNGREKPWKLDFLGIGNENWGNGGSMRPEYYVDLYRQYQAFARNYSNPDMIKVACGANADDYTWTETLMQRLNTSHTGALSLHYYTIPTGEWFHKGDAVDFSEAEYYSTMQKACQIDELLTKHSAIMDKYDPDKKIKLIVDEWGCWYDVEKGTNPAFLYQQNTMRDALVAAVHLNAFNQHSERVTMANLAQTMNVLQSVLLSNGKKLVKTPTWYVFRLFLEHHDSELVKTSAAVPYLDENGAFPQISYSVSKKNNRIFLTVANLSLSESCQMLIDPEDCHITSAEGSIITAEVHTFHDFDGEEQVNIQKYDNFTIVDGKLSAEIPSCSIVSLHIDESQ